MFELNFTGWLASLLIGQQEWHLASKSSVPGIPKIPLLDT